jgi:hypothetical protein
MSVVLLSPYSWLCVEVYAKKRCPSDQTDHCYLFEQVHFPDNSLQLIIFN